MKKLLLSIFAATAVLAANAAPQVVIDGLGYDLNDENMTASVVPLEGSIGSPDITGDIVVPETITTGGSTYTVTAVGIDSFYNSTVTSVVLPNTVTSVGRDAFYGISTLQSVTFGSGISELPGSLFINCTALTDVYCYAVNPPYIYTNTFPTNIRGNIYLHVPAASVSAYMAAANWSALKAILPIAEPGTMLNKANVNGLVFDLNHATLTAVLAAAYSQPSNYDLSGYDGDVVIPATIQENGNTYIVTAVGAECFYQKNPTSIDFPNTIITVGWEAFWNIPSLTAITFPDSMQTLEDGAIYACYYLTEITFGSGTLELGGSSSSSPYCIANLSALNKITCLAEVPPTATATTFDPSVKTHTTLVVPFGKAAAYQAAPYWGGFMEYVELPSTGVEEIATDNIVAPRYFTIKGIEVANPEEGQIVIEVRGAKSVKKVFRR